MKKIPTLFERTYRNHTVVEIKPNITPGCEDAFIHGVATIKYDGACCAIINGKFYKRYDAKNGKPVPKGAIKCQEAADPITGHFPCWVAVNENNPADKWFIKAYQNCRCSLEDGTYEAIGPHFQGNPYNEEQDCLVRHGRRLAFVERTFKGVKEWLSENDEEGLVFWLNGKPVCKVKRSDFGLPWNESKNV